MMKNNNYIVLLGPPGSGKGTQAKKIAQNFGYFCFGMGDLMRQEAEAGTETGRKFQEIWDRGKGELVPDEIADEFIEKKIIELGESQKIVFDGYPRTLSQAENLNKILNIPVADLIVLNIVVTKDLLLERMATRKVCADCGKVFFRPDESGVKSCDKCQGSLIQRQEDDPKVVEKRIDVYEEQTTPLISYYKNNARLIDIDGTPAIDEVEKIITQKLGEILNEN